MEIALRPELRVVKRYFDDFTNYQILWSSANLRKGAALKNQCITPSAATAPASCATMNIGASLRAMPAKLLVSARDRHCRIGERSGRGEPVGGWRLLRND